MTNQRTVKVYMNDEGGPLAFTDADFTAHPDESVTITIDGEIRAYFPPHSYKYTTAE